MPSRVPTHRPQAVASAAKQYDQGGDRKADKAFYKSRAWRACRAAILAEFPLCAQCDREGRLTPAEHVHHLQERKERPELAFEASNLESLCQPCHNAMRGQLGG